MLICAVMSLLIMTLLVVLGGAATDGYSHAAQFISELGASGAQHEGWVRFAGFAPASVTLLLFCVLAFLELPCTVLWSFGLFGLAVYAGGYGVAAVFPCDLGCRPEQPSTAQLIHNIGGLVGYVLAPAFLFAMARAVKPLPDASRVATCGYIAAAISLLAVLTLTPDSQWVGLSQRALELSVLGWTVVLAYHLRWQDHRTAQ